MKHDFERSLERGIPLAEAAGYFHRLKTAGWGDPPDETGQLEGAFAAPIEQVIASIADVAAVKFQLMVAYHIFAESMRGIAQHGIAEVFHEHAEHHRAASEAYLKRAAALGGGPIHLPEMVSPPASADPVGILQMVARAEQECIAAQRELKALVGEENPLSFQIEGFMVEDQHHLDEAWQMLPADVQRTPVIDVGAEGGEPPMDAPPEEDMAAAPQDAAGPPVPGPEGEPEPELEEELPPEEEELPPAAEGVPPKPKAKTEPEAKKEAFVRGLALLLKEAGDLIDLEERRRAKQGLSGVVDDANPLGADLAAAGPKAELEAAALASKTGPGADVVPFPGKGERLWRKAKQLPGQASEAISGLAERAGKGLNELPIPAKAGLAGAGYGAALGSLTGGAAALARSPRDERELAAKGGPITQFMLDHPVLGGAGLTGASAGGAAATIAALRGRHPGIALPAAVGAALAPSVALGAADRALKKTASGFLAGLRKLAAGLPEPGFGGDPGAAPLPDQQPQVVPQPSMEAPGPQPPMATPPGQAKYAPVNYLEAEETARRAQASNEAEFYRTQAQQATGQVQGMSAQIADVQAQLDQLSAQAAESQSQVMAANQEAVSANDQMLNQATLAARMRMGMQQLRAQMMEVASQDPEQLAAAAGGPTPMDIGSQAQMAGAPAAAPMGPPGEASMDPSAAPGAQPGTPGASPDPAAQPGAAPAGAGGDAASASPPSDKKPDESSGGGEAKKGGGETTVSIKKGSANLTLGQELVRKLPFAVAGAAAGGITGSREGRAVPALQQRVGELEQQEGGGGFGRSVELAKAHLAVAKADEARAKPGKAALQGMAAGAGMGLAAGTAVPFGISGARKLVDKVQKLRSL